MYNKSIGLQGHTDVDNKDKYVLELREGNHVVDGLCSFCQQEASSHVLSPISIIHASGGSIFTCSTFPWPWIPFIFY